MLLYPLVSEKATQLASEKTYVFRVSFNENKSEIKKEIERLYKVKVEKVNIVRTKAKRRRLGRVEGRKAGFKKSIVTLKEGYVIEGV